MVSRVYLIHPQPLTGILILFVCIYGTISYILIEYTLGCQLDSNSEIQLCRIHGWIRNN